MPQSTKFPSEARCEPGSDSLSQADEEKQSISGHRADEHHYPTLKVAVPVIIALYLSVFLVAIDRTIIGTAIPAISDEFESFGDISWYGSAYLVTLCAFQLLAGRVYTHFAPKWIFLACIVIFELGSTVSAAAPTSAAFIVGRAIAGIGSAGIFSGAMILMIATIPLRRRPLIQAAFSVIFGLSSVLGPLVGGAFTTKVSWRWCFWINLPIGAMTIIIVVLILPQQPAPGCDTLKWRQKMMKLDPVGTVLLLPAIICIILALQWGGFVYSWNDKRIIILLLFGCLLFICFIGVQLWKKDDATVAPRIICHRSILAGFIGQICIGSAMMILAYFLPIWFQAIQSFSAIRSGIAILPFMLGIVAFSILAGIFVSRIGYYTPPMIIGSAVMIVGGGLLTMFTTNTDRSHWIGFQVVFGAGLGLCMQQANMAAQTVLAKKDVPIGISLMWFAQSFGGAIFLPVAQSLLQNNLKSGLQGIEGLNPDSISRSGATQLRTLVSNNDVAIVLMTYNHALIQVFYVVLGLSCVAFFCSLFMEWESVRGAEKK